MKIFQHTHKAIILTGVLLSQGVSHGAIGDGLLNYWNLNDNANDTAGGNPGATGTSDDHGTINGTVTFVDSFSAGFGKAGSFPGGAGNNITVPDPTGGTDDIDRTGADITISIWFQAADWNTGWQAILAHGEGQDYRIARSGTANPTKFAAVVGTTDMQTVTTYGAPPAGDGLWHHLVATGINGGIGSLYVNGLLESTSTGLADPTVSIAPSGGNNNLLCIGCNPDNGREFNGLIDDIAMWDRALAADEVQAIYDAGVAGQDLSSFLNPGDDDNDGLPNFWEEQNLGDGAKDDNGSVNPHFGPNGDPDNDSSNNLAEYDNGTDPQDEDSDDDTLLDGVETNNGINSWVSANDTGTDPLRKDTDGDGLDDNLEDNGGTFVSATQTGSNPTVVDTDSDTMPDGYEVTNQLDPNVDDSGLDPDSDNLTNITEFGLNTDPQDADTDDDFSNDDVEGTRSTDPLDPDTDNDTVLDGYETNNGTNSYVSDTDTGTDPLDPDSDDDGTHDGAELAASRNPTVADGLTSGFGQRLVAYWNFDNNLDDIAHTLPGESIVADNGSFDGTLADASYAPEGFFGSSALSLNGGGGWVTVPASIDTLRGAENAVTVSAWVKIAAFNANWQSIVSHGEGSQWRLARRNNEETIAWAGGVGDIPGANVGPVISDNMWHHVVATSDPVNFWTKLYIDGVEIATGGAPNISDTANGGLIPDLFIGANPNSGGREWGGEIDDLAIWGRALSADEIALIYNDGDGESIENLLGGGGPPLISDIFFTPGVGIGGNGQFTMTFTSRSNVFYGIYGSDDLNDDFPLEIEDAVLGADGSTTVTFDNPNPGASALFFRVEPPRL
ncbi:LamG-like jellyroll fold domain-containing protein [Verrucomicrobiaceae bacterium 227]